MPSVFRLSWGAKSKVPANVEGKPGTRGSLAGGALADAGCDSGVETENTNAPAGGSEAGSSESGLQMYPLTALAATTAGLARYACAFGWPIRPL